MLLYPKELRPAGLDFLPGASTKPLNAKEAGLHRCRFQDRLGISRHSLIRRQVALPFRSAVSVRCIAARHSG